MKKTTAQHSTLKMTFSFLLFSSIFGFTVLGNTQAQATETPTAVAQNVKTSAAKEPATFTTSVKSINQVVQADDYATAITQGVNWINTQVAAEKLTGWDALALVRSSTGITDAQKAQIKTNIETNYADSSTQHQPTDYARDVIGLICVGADPTNVNGQNLVQEAVTNGIAANADIYAVTYGLIAATAAQSSHLGNVQTADLQIMVTNLLGMQNSGTGYWTDSYGYSLDTTGMALQALALYIDNVEFNTNGRITNAVNAATDAVTRIGDGGALQNDGNFKDPFATDAAVNSSSDAMLIAGLVASDQELPGSSLGAFLSFQVIDGIDAGSFNWTSEMTYDRQLSTQQAVYALNQYSYSADGKGSIFDFSANPVN